MTTDQMRQAQIAFIKLFGFQTGPFGISSHTSTGAWTIAANNNWMIFAFSGPTNRLRVVSSSQRPAA